MEDVERKSEPPFLWPVACPHEGMRDRQGIGGTRVYVCVCVCAVGGGGASPQSGLMTGAVVVGVRRLPAPRSGHLQRQATLIDDRAGNDGISWCGVYRVVKETVQLVVVVVSNQGERDSPRVGTQALTRG